MLFERQIHPRPVSIHRDARYLLVASAWRLDALGHVGAPTLSVVWGHNGALRGVPIPAPSCRSSSNDGIAISVKSKFRTKDCIAHAQIRELFSSYM